METENISRETYWNAASTDKIWKLNEKSKNIFEKNSNSLVYSIHNFMYVAERKITSGKQQQNE